MKNIFVFGLDTFNRDILEALPDADQFRFHGLLKHCLLKGAASYNFSALLSEARRRLQHFDKTVDAIINFWDFPASMLHPILCREFGLAGPNLEAVIKCCNKGYSRLEQQLVIPDYIPRFSIFDPFADNPLSQISLNFPFWIKPVLSYSGFLGFHISNENDFREHIRTIRNNIGRFAEPYAKLLETVDLPSTLTWVTAHHCIAEEIISSGRQCTWEGFSYRHSVKTYGLVDSIRYPNRVSFSRYQYPSTLPEHIMQRIRDVSETIIGHIGLDMSAFNIEFFYDEVSDRLTLLEINSRISQSHALLFQKVDGTANHRIVVDLALGRKPLFQHRKGNYKYAVKMFARKFRNGVVTRTPTPTEIERAQQRVPEATVVVPVKQGKRLSELLDQDSYSYQYAIVYLGGQSMHEMAYNLKHVMEALPFAFEPIEEAAKTA